MEIAFDDYMKDMQEAGELASSIITQQKEQIEELKSAISLLIYCANRVEIPTHLFGEKMPYQVFPNIKDDTVIYQTITTNREK